MKSLLVCLLLVALATAAPSGKPMFMRGRNKIVGGHEAEPGDIPYIISFQETKFGMHNHFCGGSIYTEVWVITSAACVRGENMEYPTHLRIVAGEKDMRIEEVTEQTVAITRIVPHKHYNPLTLENDIALLQLESPLIFDAYVRNIGLPQPQQEFEGSAFVSGWGVTFEDGDNSDVLRVVSVPILSTHDCAAMYGVFLRDDMMCAGDHGIDACYGDRGGPLTCTYNGYTFLCGIVSWGYGCARPHNPRIYTKVAYFIHWIQTNAGTLE